MNKRKATFGWAFTRRWHTGGLNPYFLLSYHNADGTRTWDKKRSHWAWDLPI